MAMNIFEIEERAMLQCDNEELRRNECVSECPMIGGIGGLGDFI